MEPLASKIRPNTLKEFLGQKHIVDEEGPLFIAIKQKHLFSFVLWGPPGVGKTTLAKIYARSLKTEIFELSAVSAGKNDIKKSFLTTREIVARRYYFLMKYIGSIKLNKIFCYHMLNQES